MKRQFSLFLALALAAWAVHVLTVSGEEREPTGGPATAARVIRVIDGDSLMVELDGLPVKLRLLGIDAPEYTQEWGPQAAAALRRWTHGAKLTLTFGPRRTDRYDRLLAYVWNGDRLLNAALVRGGLALPYMLDPGDPHAEDIQAALAEAKTARTGFWQQGGLRLSPQLWRKQHR